MKRASKMKALTSGRDGSVVAMQRPPLRLNVAMDLPRRLDLEAAVELQHGHVAAAEMLARRAAEMREGRQ